MKKLIRKFVFIILMHLFLFNGHVISSLNYAESAAGSRVFALGQSAAISYLDILNSIGNPAALAHTEEINSSFYYSSPVKNAKILGGGLAIPADGYGSFGLSFINFKMDFAERDIAGRKTGSGAWKEQQAAISYGRQLYKEIKFGFNAKWIKNEFTGSGDTNIPYDNIGVDIAASIFPKFENIWINNLGLGFVLKNIFQLNDSGDHLPKEFRFIAENGYKISNHAIFIVMNYSRFENAISKYQTRFHLGAEYSYDFVSLRLGYNDDIFALGTGIQYKMISLDYGYGDYFEDKAGLRPMHNLTLAITL